MTAPNVAALFLFNNRFERVLPALDRLYAERFPRRQYIMPFATERRADIISVQECGWYFSGHLAQGARDFLAPDVTHYVVISDDLYLNPRLDHRNIVAALGLGERSAWIKGLASADALRHRWEWSADAAFELKRMSITDLWSQLPAPEDARERFARLGLDLSFRRPRTRAEWRFATRDLPRASRAIWLKYLAMWGKPAPFPMLSSYADFLVVPAHAMPDFVHWCGLFAAMNIFAEIAVPTALALACDEIVTELPIGAHFGDRDTVAEPRGSWRGVEGEGAEGFAQRLDRSLDRLQAEFPADWLYFHPVKLSGWR